MSTGVRQLVGRKRELALLERELTRLERQQGGVLQLVGEPGIGKTRLIYEALDRAVRMQYTTLVGRGDEFQRDMPFGIFVDALDDHLAMLSSQIEKSLPPAHLLQLGIVFPSLSAMVTGDSAQLPNDRHRAYRAVRLLLEQLAVERPMVLALDDLHWADPGSLELFSYLVRNQPRAGVLIVGAQRPQSTSLLSSIDRPDDGSFEYIELLPLEREDASTLFPGDVDRATREALLEESGGNPFYLEQLTRSAPRTADGQSALGGATQVPDVPAAVVHSIANEISDLSAQALTVLQAAAVVGDPFEPYLVADTAACSREDTLVALDELVVQDLIRPDESGRNFRFRHPIVRRAVYESAGPGWRLTAHARAAAALEQRGAAPELRAHHVERSARVGDELAIAVLTKAAQANAWRAPMTAAGWYESALSLLPDQESSAQRRMELLLQRSMALAAAGQLERSRDTLRDLLGQLPRELITLRGQAVSVIAMLDQILSNHEQAERLLLRTLHEIPDENLTEHAMLCNVLAVGRMFQGDFDGALQMGSDGCRVGTPGRPVPERDLGQHGGGRLVQLRRHRSCSHLRRGGRTARRHDSRQRTGDAPARHAVAGLDRTLARRTGAGGDPLRARHRDRPRRRPDRRAGTDDGRTGDQSLAPRQVAGGRRDGARGG